MKVGIVLLLVLVAPTAFSQQRAEVVKFDRLESLMTSKTEKIQVINFWATWCGPCVKELPHFESLEARQDKSVQITLINLDYADKINKVNAFVNKRKITSRVWLLDEVDYNSWIDRVDPSWAGAIPATLIINTATGQRKFVDKPLTEADLDTYINALKSSN